MKKHLHFFQCSSFKPLLHRTFLCKAISLRKSTYYGQRWKSLHLQTPLPSLGLLRIPDTALRKSAPQSSYSQYPHGLPQPAHGILLAMEVALLLASHLFQTNAMLGRFQGLLWKDVGWKSLVLKVYWKPTLPLSGWFDLGIWGLKLLQQFSHHEKTYAQIKLAQWDAELRYGRQKQFHHSWSLHTITLDLTINYVSQCII